MNLKSFTSAYIFRLLLLAVCMWASIYTGLTGEKTLAVVLFSFVIFLVFNLYHKVTDTNRRLARFFESVRYSDFAIRFASGTEKGDSFEEVNRQFNEVLEAFRQTRAEKEANLLFLNTMVQHLSTGILAFDAQSQVLVSNNAAFQLLGVYRLNHLNDLPEKHHTLIHFVRDINSKGKVLYQSDANRQLSVQGVILNLQGRVVRLITLQNIHPELQRKEVDAWRNLTRVLRHEMMNSITPIVSLVETAQEIVKHDLPQNEASEDLTEALEVVASRSRSLVSFVEAYRSFSAVPHPKCKDISVKRLIEQVVQLSIPELKIHQIQLNTEVTPEDMTIFADSGQIEMILLNLIKNAREVLDDSLKTGSTQGEITIKASMDARQKAYILIEDNGPGIADDLLEEVFIPFFTTKETGTGVGLSISKQIMQLHGGDIRIISAKDKGACFMLEF